MTENSKGMWNTQPWQQNPTAKEDEPMWMQNSPEQAADNVNYEVLKAKLAQQQYDDAYNKWKAEHDAKVDAENLKKFRETGQTTLPETEEQKRAQFEKELRERNNKRSADSSANNMQRPVETNVVGSGTNKSYTQGIGNNQEQTNNADINSMINKINYMNKKNGADKAIDATATAQKLYELYGDKAAVLLDKAIAEPTNYATATGANIEKSREAVEHLKSIDKDKAKDFSENILNNPAFNKQNSTVNNAPTSQNAAGENDKRATDLKAITELATGNPEQYEVLKNMYQNIIAGNLPGGELAKYFLDIMKEVESALAKNLESQLAKDTLNKTPETIVESEADKKREEDKLSCRNLYKDEKKFAKAKESYQNIANNASGEEKAKAQYYLDIMKEVEKEGAVKNAMTNDAKAADSKSDNLEAYIANYLKNIQNQGIAGNTASDKNQINVLDMMMKNAKQND